MGFVNVDTQQKLYVMGFGTVCLTIMLCLGFLAAYALIHDGAVGSQVLDVIKNTLQWAFTAIGVIVPVHLFTNRGSGPSVAPAVPATSQGASDTPPGGVTLGA